MLLARTRSCSHNRHRRSYYCAVGHLAVDVCRHFLIPSCAVSIISGLLLAGSPADHFMWTPGTVRATTLLFSPTTAIQQLSHDMPALHIFQLYLAAVLRWCTAACQTISWLEEQALVGQSICYSSHDCKRLHSLLASRVNL